MPNSLHIMPLYEGEPMLSFLSKLNYHCWKQTQQMNTSWQELCKNYETYILNWFFLATFFTCSLQESMSMICGLDAHAKETKWHQTMLSPSCTQQDGKHYICKHEQKHLLMKHVLSQLLCTRRTKYHMETIKYFEDMSKTNM